MINEPKYGLYEYPPYTNIRMQCTNGRIKNSTSPIYNLIWLPLFYLSTLNCSGIGSVVNNGVFLSPTAS